MLYLDDFIIDVSVKSTTEDEDFEFSKERSCDSLWICIVTTLNQGLRNGGGIGDVLRPIASSDYSFPLRLAYDMMFFFVVIILVLNLIFGVIVDTFADLRSERQVKEETMKNSCFICGLNRKVCTPFKSVFKFYDDVL